MARTGLYKSDVKKARDHLVGQGRHPSVDAVRVELGNTGSKTTIHKYLKELEGEDGGVSAKAPVSDALQDLVARLAAQLQAEADEQIATIRKEAGEAISKSNAGAEQMRTLNLTLADQLKTAEASLVAQKNAAETLQRELWGERSARQAVESQLESLRERVAENERHRQSIEEKHQHAREALEHYRVATKEQRDQDIRRHEQQSQTLQAEIRQLRQDAIIKQEEVSRVNQEAGRLVTELSHAKQAAYESQSAVRDLTTRLETLSGTKAAKEQLETRLTEKEAELDRLQAQLASAEKERSLMRQQVQQQEVALAAATAKFNAQDGLIAELKEVLSNSSGRPEPQS
jgi:chromosome segregation ATPase